MKKKRRYDKASRQMKKTLKHTKGVLLSKGEWEKNRPVHVEEMRAKHTSSKLRRGLSKETVKDVHRAIVIRSSEGATNRQIAAEMGINRNVVEKILKTKFLDTEQGVNVLRSLLLDNAVHFGAQTRQKAEDLNGMQSAVATGIMTSKFIELDKHLANRPNEVDMDALSEIGRELKDLNDIVKGAGIDAHEAMDEIEDD